MEWLQTVASLIFLVSIVLVITGWIDSIIAVMNGDHHGDPLGPLQGVPLIRLSLFQK